MPSKLHRDGTRHVSTLKISDCRSTKGVEELTGQMRRVARVLPRLPIVSNLAPFLVKDPRNDSCLLALHGVGAFPLPTKEITKCREDVEIESRS